jgi:hypothetical protein
LKNKRKGRGKYMSNVGWGGGDFELLFGDFALHELWNYGLMA